jgi:hypothetical protein
MEGQHQTPPQNPVPTPARQDWASRFIMSKRDLDYDEAFSNLDMEIYLLWTRTCVFCAECSRYGYEPRHSHNSMCDHHDKMFWHWSENLSAERMNKGSFGARDALVDQMDKMFENLIIDESCTDREITAYIAVFNARDMMSNTILNAMIAINSSASDRSHDADTDNDSEMFDSQTTESYDK